MFFGFSGPEDKKTMVFGKSVNYSAIGMMLLSRRLAFANDFSTSLFFVPFIITCHVTTAKLSLRFALLFICLSHHIILINLQNMTLICYINFFYLLLFPFMLCKQKNEIYLYVCMECLCHYRILSLY